MLYRKLGRTGLNVSEIGLGCEYVWFAEEERVIHLVREAVDAGVNYIDLFVGTPSTREFFGKALEGRRHKVYLAAHLGCADREGQYVKTRDPHLCKDFLNQFYEKLHTDYIDVLFLHNCDTREDLQGIMNGWMYAYAKQLKDEGKVGFIGFSSHNTQIAMEAVQTGKIDVLMFPVNPLFNLFPQDSADALMKGRQMQQLSEKEKACYPTKQQLYSLCQQLDVGLVAMKPFAAGNILKNHAEGQLKGILSLTPVQAVSYVLSFPQVSCLVPGFANVDELHQSLAYCTATEAERDCSQVNKVLTQNLQRRCMYCNHCQPCPKKIDIAEVTRLADMAEKELTDDLRKRYHQLPVSASACLHCGQCTKRCPFGVDASANMERAARFFEAHLEG